MTHTFERRYSDDELEAAITAYLDRGIKPMRVVVDMAAAGQLSTKDGRKVRPFQMSLHTLRDYVQRERRRRTGRINGHALDNPDDVLEGLRRRMVGLAHAEVAYVEGQKKGKRDPEHMRQIVRLMRELAALPKPGEGRGRAPGQKENGQKQSGETTGGLAGSLLAAHRRTPAQEHPSQQETQAENTNASSTTRSDTAQQDTEHDDSGSSDRPGVQHVRGLTSMPLTPHKS
jgi:hypothetical protein